MQNRKVTAHRISALDVRYDGQRPDIGEIVREDVGVCTKLIKLTNKTSRNFEYFACASCSNSEESHGSKNEELEGVEKYTYPRK